MAIQRKVPPQPVQWDQQSILRAIRDFAATLAGLGGTTTTPGDDTEAVVTREVTAERMINTLVAGVGLLMASPLVLVFATITFVLGHLVGALILGLIAAVNFATAIFFLTYLLPALGKSRPKAFGEISTGRR